MRRTILTLLTSVACVTSAHAEYVRAKPGSEVARVEAYCNMVASGAQQGYFAFGNSSYVAGAAIGNAIGNMIRVSEAKKNCMTMQGYEWQKPKRSARAPVGTNPNNN